MSVKVPPELTWQDKFILIAIPCVVFTIFIVANHLSRDLTVAEAIKEKKVEVDVREAGIVVKLYQQVATDTVSCRLKSSYGGNEFDFNYLVVGSNTVKFELGREVKLLGQYKANETGGVVTAPYNTKYGRTNGWMIYENRTYVGDMMQDDPMNGNMSQNQMMQNNKQAQSANQPAQKALPATTDNKPAQTGTTQTTATPANKQ